MTLSLISLAPIRRSQLGATGKPHHTNYRQHAIASTATPKQTAAASPTSDALAVYGLVCRRFHSMNSFSMFSLLCYAADNRRDDLIQLVHGLLPAGVELLLHGLSDQVTNRNATVAGRPLEPRHDVGIEPHPDKFLALLLHRLLRFCVPHSAARW
jgi:hypothetical protein